MLQLEEEEHRYPSEKPPQDVFVSAMGNMLNQNVKIVVAPMSLENVGPQTRNVSPVDRRGILRIIAEAGEDHRQWGLLQGLLRLELVKGEVPLPQLSVVPFLGCLERKILKSDVSGVGNRMKSGSVLHEIEIVFDVGKEDILQVAVKKEESD